MKATTVLLLVVYATIAKAGVVSYRNVLGVTECPSEQEHDWSIEYLMRHEYCNMFYQCTHGKPVPMFCPADLYFDLTTWQCEWAHTVDCKDRYIPEDPTIPSTPVPAPPPTTTTTPEPTTTTTTPAPTTPTTTTTTTPAPTTTTSTTTTPAPTTTTPAPTTTTTTTTTTPAPTTTTSTTTTPAPTTTTTTTTTTPAPTTTTSTTTTPAPTTTTSTTTTPAPTTTSTTTTEVDDSSIEFQDNGCPVNPHIHWLLPHETDCNLFYYCVWGELVLRECPEDLHFNTTLQVCDHQVDAGCTLGQKGQL